MRTATATTEQGTVTDAKGERREARRNTRPDGTQVVIYVSTSRRVAPAVAATFAPNAEVAQPSQLEPAELEQHLAQEDELAAAELAEQLMPTRPADEGDDATGDDPKLTGPDEAHERQMAEQADRAEQARISQQRAAQRAARRTQVDEVLDRTAPRATVGEVVDAMMTPQERAQDQVEAPAAPVKHRMTWFDYIDGAKVPHSPERKRRLSDIISVQCACGEASPTATRKEIDGWVAEHKRGLSAAA